MRSRRGAAAGRHSIMRRSQMHNQNSMDDPFAFRFNTSRRMEPQRSYYAGNRGNQFSIMQDRQGNLMPNRGMRGMSDPNVGNTERENNPNIDINVGALEDITSRESHRESKGHSKQRSSDGNANNRVVEEDQSRIQSFKNEEEKEDVLRKVKRKESKKKVNFSDSPTHIIEQPHEKDSKEETKEQTLEPQTEDKIQEGKPGESESEQKSG